MFRNVPLGVRFDQKVEVAWILVGGDRCVGAHDFFGFAIHFKGSCNGHVLTDRETKDLCRGLKAESVAAECQLMSRMIPRARILHCHVVREDCLLFQRKVLKNVWLECVRGRHLLGHGDQLWGFSVSQR